MGLLRRPLVLLVCVLTLAGLGWSSARVSADWFIWDWLRFWAWEAYWVGGCWSLGSLLLLRALKLTGLPRAESAAASMALGVVAFVMMMYAAGALGWFQPWLAVVLPALCWLANARGITASLLRRRRAAHRSTPRERVVILLGCIALAALYLPLTSPGAVGTDAAWFHLTAAQDYAREGRFVPFLADWAKNLPQLTSILHTWAFLVPGLSAPQHWVLALHTEFALLVFTLLGVNATASWLFGRALPAAWVTFFLFPAIYVYDSNLSGAADHITAFFALPLLLSTLRCVRRPSLGLAVLAGVCAAGALLTKIQAVYFVAPLAGLLLTRSCAELLRRRPGARVWLGVAAAFGTTVCVVLTPQLIKSYVFHKNPAYPFLLDWFPSTPSPPDGSQLFFEHLAPITRNQLLDNARRALALCLTFPFEVKSGFFGDVPFIGFSFNLLLPVSLLWPRRQLLPALFVALSAVFAWAYTFPVPRNLQVALPILVAITAVQLARAWNFSLLGRCFVGALLALQVVMGWDVVVRAARGGWLDALHLMQSASPKQRSARYRAYRADFLELGESLPPDAVLLLHTTYSQLGINRRTLLDWPGFQGLIDYRPMQTPRDIYRRLHELGVTHIATDPAWPAHSRQEEVLVDAFVYRHAERLGRFGGYQLWQMPSRPPRAEAPYRVLLLGLPEHSSGLYAVTALDQLDDGPRLARTPREALPRDAQPGALLRRASAVVVGKDYELTAETQHALERGFVELIAYPRYRVLLAKKRRRV